MPAPRPLALLGATAALVAAAALSPAAAQAGSKLCPGTVSFAGTTTKLAVVSPTRCATARSVAKTFDAVVSGGPLANGYSCGYAHAPFRSKYGRKVGFSCKRTSGRRTRIYGLIAD